MKKYIERTQYLDRLKGLIGTPDIKIITGIRRCGKSELLHAFVSYIENNIKMANVIFVDFFNLEYEELKNYKALYDYVEKKYVKDKINFVFIDEVQLCENFELAVNSLHNSKKYDIYITGSNAFLLSSDLTTLFTGRFLEIPVYPFSFKEFSLYYSEVKSKKNKLDDYVLKGGLAGSYEYTNETDRKAYLKDVYSTIIRRDLIKKYQITDVDSLEHLAEFMMDNISNITSPNNISNVLNINKIPANHVTIGKYIKCLCAAFLFYGTKRFDVKGKKYLETSEKYYLADLGIRGAVLGSRNIDYGRCYENIVAIELLRRGYEIYVGKLYQKEIDFVAMKGDEKIYIQVSDNITAEATFKREIDSLLQIRDAYPKILIANTSHPEYQYEGIKIVDISDWLLS